MRLLRLLGMFLLLMPLVFVQAVLADDDTYDDTPAVTDRVARISFMSGEVQLRRSDSDEWEKAAANLPLVEGDQIATGAGARVELQLDTYNYVRLAENSLLTLNTLREGQVALSLPEGTLSVRVLAFDSQKNSFEIDAPQTTVALQRAGMYRVDTGNKDSNEIRVTVTQEGQARIYTDNSGFTLKNGRTARVYLNGDSEGEPDINVAARTADEWDSWVLDRDSIIAKKLKDSYYDKYYDRDVYGAEDLGEYGDWIYTNKYGYVWRPYSNYTSSYNNWSPYRYGSWRWVPPYGWIWQGDEPWSWSTYHHGRWVYYNGGWAWTPYGSHRWRRNWWQPALVVITYSGSSICWYPLPYHYYYYNYNSHYYSSGGWGNHHNGGHHNGGNHNGGNGGGNGGGNNTGGGNTGGPPTTVIGPPIKGPKKPPLQPAGALDPAYTQAVTMTGYDGFGGVRSGIKPAPPAVATKATVRQTLADPIRLPIVTDVKIPSDVKPSQQVQVAVRNPDIKNNGGGGGKTDLIKVGAAVREPGVKLDETLRKDRVLGGRPPVEKPPLNNGSGGSTGTGSGSTPVGVRGTGAVKRDDPPVNSNGSGGDPTYVKPQRNQVPPPRNEDPVRPAGGTKSDDNDTPVRPSKPRSEPRNEPRPEPRYIPPPEQEKPRYDPPPRNDPPPRSEPRNEPRNEPRPEPRNEPRNEPRPEPRPEPKPDKPSSPPPSENKREKDGRR